jgi:hypothetical protein
MGKANVRFIALLSSFDRAQRPVCGRKDGQVCCPGPPTGPGVLFWETPEKPGRAGVLFWAPPGKPGRAGVLFWAPPEQPGRAGVLFWASPRARAGPGARESPGCIFLNTLRTQDKTLKYSDNPRTNARLSVVCCGYTKFPVAGYGPRGFMCPWCVLWGPGVSWRTE